MEFVVCSLHRSVAPHTTDTQCHWLRSNYVELTVTQLLNKFHAICRTKNFYYCVHKSLPLNPVLIKMNLVPTLISDFFQVHYFSKEVSFLYDGCLIFCILFSSFPLCCLPHQCYIYLSSYDFQNSFAPDCVVWHVYIREFVYLYFMELGFLVQCFSAFVRPQPGKFFFHKTRARSQQIYS